jgi:ABC-type phosphate transport system substrate-binding protein
MRVIFLLAASLSVFLTPAIAATEFAVIVHPQSEIESLNKNDVVNIFMGRYRKLPSGMTAVPVDFSGAQPERSQFYQAIVGKELSEIDSYWARLRFSGQGPPPRQVPSTEEILDFVSRSRGAIGYVEKRRVDKRVKIVLELPSPPGQM